MYKNTYHFEELTCKDCAMEIVDTLEKYDYIKNCYLDLDEKNITIESDKDLSREDVRNIITNILNTNEHKIGHPHSKYFTDMQSLVTDEFEFDDLCCENSAETIENELNKSENILDAKVNYYNKKIVIKHLNNVEVYNVLTKVINKIDSDTKFGKVGEINTQFKMMNKDGTVTETFGFEDIDCANCARKVEDALNKDSDIIEARVDYLDKKIIIKHNIDKDIFEKANKILRNIEHDAIMFVLEDESEHHHHHHHEHTHNPDGSITEVFMFEDIDCANCAREVEDALNKEDKIISAQVNFLNKQIIITHKEEDEIYELAKKVLKKTEPDAVMYYSDEDKSNHHHNHKHNEDGSITETFAFEDIDCANCAREVEDALNKEDKIISAQVNFLNKEIIITHNEEDDIFELAKSVLKKTEPDAVMYYKDEDEDHEEHHHHHHEECECDSCKTYSEKELREIKKAKKKKINKILLIIGGILFSLGLILMHLCDSEITANLGFSPLLSGASYIVPLCILFISAYICLSYDLLYKSFLGIIHGDVFSESFLMVVASLGSMCLCFFKEFEFFEACMVIILYKFGEYLQDKATDKSKDAIKSLIEMKKDTVTLYDGTVKKVKDVKVGEVITIKVGEQIPLDGIVKDGETSLDMKTLTGESAPVFTKVGEEILSGSINLTKVVNIEVTKEDSDSTLSKVAKLVSQASSQKSNSEQFITKFARVYTPTVMILALVAGITLGLLDKTSTNLAATIIHSVITLLVISCPCALVISIPLSYFAGIGRSSISGVLVKGGNYLEALSQAKTFVFDKTGTITKGNFKVFKICPVEGVSEEELLKTVASVEQYSMHPVAKSIQDAYNKKIDKYDNSSIEEISGGGLKAKINNDDILVGNAKLMERFNISYAPNDFIGTVLYVSLNNKFIGSIVIRDEIKEESKKLMSLLNKNKYKTIMITGDNEEVAKDVCEKVGISEYYAKQLPQEKYTRLEEIIKNNKGKVSYVGDGINDTPSLTLADVGIAMGGIGSDSAKECADIVIMNDDISKIYDAISISKKTKKIVVENIIFTMTIKVLALLAAVIPSVNHALGSYLALIAILADVGVCLIAIFNSLRVLSHKVKK